jgi:hypothetical protein
VGRETTVVQASPDATKELATGQQSLVGQTLAQAVREGRAGGCAADAKIHEK